MIRLYDFIDIIDEEYVFILDNDGLGYVLAKKEVKYRYNNDEVFHLSITSTDGYDCVVFIKINGICQNED